VWAEHAALVSADLPLTDLRVGQGSAGGAGESKPAPRAGGWFRRGMDYGPNVDGLAGRREGLPQIVRRYPQRDGGWSDDRPLERCGDWTTDEHSSDRHRSAVEPYLEKMRVAIAPLRIARGVQIKVLMAMTAGRPCVVTPAWPKD